MPLACPKVIGPISTLVTSVRVQGQLVGAKVSVISLADNLLKACSIATRGDQRFELLPNISLISNDRLVATQTYGNDTSEFPGEYMSVPVQQAPEDVVNITQIKIESCIFYKTESYLWISGCFPGAVIEAFFGGVMQGRGFSEEGIIRLKLAAKPTKDEPISIRQMVKGLGTAPNSTFTLASLLNIGITLDQAYF